MYDVLIRESCQNSAPFPSGLIQLHFLLYSSLCCLLQSTQITRAIVVMFVELLCRI